MTPLWTLVSSSPAMTRRLGFLLGEVLEPDETLALFGPLGAGKTELVQGIARGLGIPPSEHITSPTYSLVNPYRGRLPVYHLDLYRLASTHELDELGFAELSHSGAVTLVEWADRFLDVFPPTTPVVQLAHRSLRTRHITIGVVGQSVQDASRAAALVNMLQLRLLESRGPAALQGSSPT